MASTNGLFHFVCRFYSRMMVLKALLAMSNRNLRRCDVLELSLLNSLLDTSTEMTQSV